MSRLYLFAGFAGTLLPFAAFGEWITHYGFSPNDDDHLATTARALRLARCHCYGSCFNHLC